MINRLSAVTPLTDVNYGSVWTTMLEAAAQEDDEQYFQMLELIRAYSLDTASGSDLDDRAFEYGLTRLTARTSSTFVTVGDSAITKVETGCYSGLPGSSAGSMYVLGDGSTGFSPSGSIIIGRGTPNAETKPYTSIDEFPNYVRFNLSAALSYDHGTDETIILSQGGSRLIPAGTTVKVPASDLSPEISFSLDANAVILDGERVQEDVAVTAITPGADGNVPVGTIIRFDSLPFSTAFVFNPSRVTNGRDIETDQELRDRIKNHIQSLSRGTAKAIITGIIDLTSETDNKRVVSAAMIEPTTPADVVKLFIDDGTGFVPEFNSVGSEVIVPQATGGEKFVNVNNFPVVKAFVETQNEEPYNMSAVTELFVEVGGQVETITFTSNDFATPAQATAQEILQVINRTASLFEARVSSGGAKVRIFSRANIDEQIRVTGGDSNAQLAFPTDTKFTTKLYLQRNNELKLLSKDGTTAVIESGNSAGYNFSTQKNLCLIVNGKVANPVYVTFSPDDLVNPTSGTAAEIAAIFNAQAPGVEAIVTSNGTKVSLSSDIKRSEKSKVRVVETFTKVFTYNGTSYGDITNQSKTNAVNVMLIQNDQDYLYFGHADVRFRSIFFAFSTPASASVTFTLEYFNGVSWASLPCVDGTQGLTTDGEILFPSPASWSKTTVNGAGPYYWVRLKRDQASLAQPPIESRIKICSANEVFGFSEVERLGSEKDYTLNRFLGQIELTTPLLANDVLSVGSTETRAKIISNAQPFGLSGGETLNVEIDGVVQTVVFQAGDFFTAGSALASEVIARLNKELRGAVAEVFGVGRISIRTNSWGPAGSIRVSGGTANSVLQFTATVIPNLEPHSAYIESGAVSPYVFAKDQEVIVIMDGNSANNLTVPCYRKGQLTTGSTSGTLYDTTLQPLFPLNTDLVDTDGFYVIMTSGAANGDKREIVSYTASQGKMVLSSSLSAAPADGDNYQIVPKTAYHLEKLWNNKQITLLSVQAEVKASSSGTRVQIASKKTGEDSSVQVSGGTGNTILLFNTQVKLGVDGYRYFTGLAQKVQWTIDGRADDQDNYPGVRAAGVQVEVLEPVRRPIRVEVDVTAREGVTLASITNDVKSAISNYINTLTVGGDVIVSEIIVAVKEVSGVFDVTMISPTSNIAIADNELARIDESAIVVG